ncbi:hypothetical protein [Endozoicomonas sp. ALB115]|uniref:hypothetical protein n=1 Tax=Endozoicomonas sp. ALB115 TaxID=3403074 RepID=UPI003BB6744B
MGSLAKTINGLIQSFNKHRCDSKSFAFKVPSDIRNLISHEITLKNYSASAMARSSLIILRYLDNQLSEGNLEMIPYIPSIIIWLLEPFCPKYCHSLRDIYNLCDAAWKQFPLCHRESDLPELKVFSE